MGDVDPTLAAITDTYNDWLSRHGADSSRGVGWHDVQMQLLRFDVLALVMEGAEPVTSAPRAPFAPASIALDGVLLLTEGAGEDRFAELAGLARTGGGAGGWTFAARMGE